MKKLLLVLVALVSVITVVSCNKAEAPTLTIFQNKVEIGEALTAYAEAWGLANDVKVEVVTCGGDSCAYGDQILAEFQKDIQPDIFVIEGMGGYNDYQDYILSQDGAAWLADTDLAFKVDGVVYGFPVAVEGWGLAYNLEILTAAGVNPASLTSIGAYRTAFAAIQAYYDANSMADYSVVSMAAGDGMTWVTGLHNFNGYLSTGLAYDDSSVIDDLNNGVANDTRLAGLADWVELLFQYADQTVLLQGTYDTQVQLFDSGHAAFIHQGNWIDPNLDEATFEMGYAPHATVAGTVDSIFVSAPSYYVINTNSDAITEAKAFLDDLALTTAGAEYMVNEAKMVPAFKSITLQPSTPLSKAVASWMASGNIYAWWQNDMPSGFGMNTVGPIYTAYASGQISKAQFIAQIKAAIEAIGA
ncbi:MAG: ABC transporter substrate-binding protein [Candidatus Izemoplasmatales bacterium]|nr:ABC transporter substrate-binding protein [Candidatus Izemoplasmatales bacterium]